MKKLTVISIIMVLVFVLTACAPQPHLLVHQWQKKRSRLAWRISRSAALISSA